MTLVEESAKLEITDDLQKISLETEETTAGSAKQTSDELSTAKPDQKQHDLIFQLLKENRLDEATRYVQSGALKTIDCEDEHGTTPLQYAAFRGFYDLCVLLIARGADVNAKTHDQGYSALMFAAVANHTRVVSLLLAHEADVDYTNTIGRTASQLASFVSASECVDLINGHVSKRALLYFTTITEISETEPKLPGGQCADELHKLLINTSNYSPIRFIKLIRHAANNVLMRNADRIVRTLDAFVRKAFKNEEADCPNDLLSIKLHYFKFIFEYLIEQRKLLLAKAKPVIREDDWEARDALDAKVIDLCLRSFIQEESVKVTNKHGGHVELVVCRAFEERFLRECLRQFPYKECAMLRQMVTVLAKQEVGSATTAQFVLTGCLNGQRLNAEPVDEAGRPFLQCETCTWRSGEAKWCTHCGPQQVAYCDQFCQRVHWPVHKNQKFDTNGDAK